MKNLLGGGMLALVLVLGASTGARAASSPATIRFGVSVVVASRTATPMAGGADSSAADEAAGIMFSFAQAALAEAENSQNQTEIGLAYDTYIVALLAFLAVDGYNHGYFSFSQSSTGEPDNLADVLLAGYIVVAVEELATSLEQAGNANAIGLEFYATATFNFLELAILNGD